MVAARCNHGRAEVRHEEECDQKVTSECHRSDIGDSRGGVSQNLGIMSSSGCGGSAYEINLNELYFSFCIAERGLESTIGLDFVISIASNHLLIFIKSIEFNWPPIRVAYAA